MTSFTLAMRLLLVHLACAAAFHVQLTHVTSASSHQSSPRCASPSLGEADELGGAISSTFGEIFSSFFQPNAAKQAEIDRAYAEQLEVAERRRNPEACGHRPPRHDHSTHCSQSVSSQEGALATLHTPSLRCPPAFDTG